VQEYGPFRRSHCPSFLPLRVPLERYYLSLLYNNIITTPAQTGRQSCQPKSHCTCTRCRLRSNAALNHVSVSAIRPNHKLSPSETPQPLRCHSGSAVEWQPHCPPPDVGSGTAQTHASTLVCGYYLWAPPHCTHPSAPLRPPCSLPSLRPLSSPSHTHRRPTLVTRATSASTTLHCPARARMLTALSIEQYSFSTFTTLLYRPPCGGIALDVYNYS